MKLRTKYEIGDVPHSEYPRPQFKRDSYLSLNGYWSFKKAKIGDDVYDLDEKILVPFSPESINSGIGDGFCLCDDEMLLYERSFNIGKEMMKGVTYLHFGAVDQECFVYINGTLAGSHKGGYTPFHIEIQDYIREGENTIRVKCTDITERSHGARGKQSSHPGKIWYTAQSGIWQSIWMESVPKEHIKDITVRTYPDTGTVRIITDSDIKKHITVYDNGRQIISCDLNRETELHYDFELWSPESPKIYSFVISTDSGDTVGSYFGVRSFAIGKDSHGTPRLMLNGKPYFMNGVLDQGYWSDGLLTPPSDEAIYDELRMLKNMGFNMIRKHIKIEPMRWYYYCDMMGLIVWQDIVNGGGEYKFSHIAAFPFLGFKHKDSDYKYFSRENEGGREEYIVSLHETVCALKNVTSIGVWVPFNEGWGQFDSYKITCMLKEQDGTRIIDSVSGWHDQGRDKTTLRSMHTYYTPLRVPRDTRPVVLSEFGGYSIKTPDHVYSEKEFGYKIFRSEESFCHAVSELYLKKLLPLISKGLCAAVYTQVSDVEEEINGLVTYDRAVIKIPVAFMRDINDKIDDEARKIK